MILSNVKKHSKYNVDNFINYLAIIIYIGFFFALIKSYISGAYLGYEWPRNNFLFQPLDLFNDLRNPLARSGVLEPYPHEGYFPLTFIILQPLTFFSFKVASTLFTILFTLAVLTFNYIFILKNKLTTSRLYLFISLSFFSYPILFCLDRGNVEIFCFIFISFFLLFYIKDKINYSIIFLSMAILIKPYMALYALIFIFKKNYKNFVFTSILTTILFFLCLGYFKGGIFVNFIKLNEGLQGALNFYTTNNYSWYSSSFSELVKVIIKESQICNFYCFDLNENEFFTISSKLFSFSIALSSLYVCFKSKYDITKILLVITILVIGCTPVSYDYKLILFYIPIYSMLSYTSDFIENKGKLVFIIIGLILIPKHYYFLDDHLATSISSFINPFLMVVLLIYVLLKRNNNAQ